MTDHTELRRLLDEPRGPRQYRRDHYNCCPCRDCKAMRADYMRWWRARPAAGARVSVPVAALTAVLDQLDAAEAALARVRELHERWPIHGDGDHPEDCDCGDPWMTVCRLCCTDGKDQHETCAAYHDHGPDKPICPTIAALEADR